MEKVAALGAGATRPAIRIPSLVEVEIRPLVKKLGFFNVSRLNLLQPIKGMDESVVQDSAAISGNNHHHISAVGKSTNILWHKSSVDKLDRQQLLQQRGCVIWITGLSGSVLTSALAVHGHNVCAWASVSIDTPGEVARGGLQK